MKRPLTILAILALTFLFGFQPAHAAGSTTVVTPPHPIVVPPAATAGRAESACMPHVVCIPTGLFTLEFDNSSTCTWRPDISWGDHTPDTSFTWSPGPPLFIRHQYGAPGVYTVTITIPPGTSSAPNTICLPNQFIFQVQFPAISGAPIGGPITFFEELGGGSPSEPDASCSCATAGDPVDSFSGNLIERLTDLALPGRGLALNVTQTYNSLAASTDLGLGNGWTMPYFLHLSTAADGSVTVHEEAGSQITFTSTATGFTAPPRVVATLSKNPDGSYTLVRDQRLTYQFNSQGQLLSESDRNGYTTTLGYLNGQLATVTDSSGRTIHLLWQGNHVLSMFDAGQRLVDFGYDSAGDLTSVTQFSVPATRWHYAYDSQHQLIQITDPRGIVTQNTYDAQHRVIEQILDPSTATHPGLNRTTTWSYTVNPDGSQTTTITDPAGHEASETFTFGELTGMVQGAGSSSAATWSFAYDPATVGRTLTVDPNGHHWTATYDAHGNVLTHTDPLGRTTTYTYDAQNDLLTSTDPQGVTTTNTYDARGNLLAVNTPLGSSGQTRTTTFTYGDPSHPGDITAVTDPDGHTWQATYDLYGDQTSLTNPDGDTTTWTYNPLGWLLTGTTPRGNLPNANARTYTTTYSHTPFFGDVSAITDALGRTTRYTYDPDGNITSVTAPSGATTRYGYDGANEPIATIRPNGVTLHAQFNPDGTLTAQIDGLAHTTRYAYNALDQLIATTDPLGRVTQQSEDGVGNLLTVTDPSGRVTTGTYDAANELQGISYSDGTTPNVTNLQYDHDGRLVSMSDGSGTSTWTYDSLGRITGTDDGAGQQVGYGYDLTGNLTSLTYPAGQTVTQRFDLANRLTSVTDWLGNTTTFRYDPDGNLVQTAFPTMQTDSAVYNPADQLTAILDRAGTQTLAAFTYQRNADSLLSVQNVTGIPGPNQADAYTSLDQLCLAAPQPGSCGSSGSGGTSYSYDAADHLTQIGSASYSYDAAGELTGITGSAGATSVTSDPEGNRISITPASGSSTTYSYDQANRLTLYQHGTTTASYTYDGTGLRVSTTVNGQTEQLAWEQARPFSLLLQDGNTSYLYGPAGSPFEQITGSTVRYLHHDALGSVRFITSSSGQVTGTASYDAYGQSIGSTGERSAFGFAGQFTDSESGLIDMRAREYDPATGQFLQRDPLTVLTGQPYSYANDDPGNVVDPSGLIEASGGGLPDLFPPDPLSGNDTTTVCTRTIETEMQANDQTEQQQAQQINQQQQNQIFQQLQNNTINAVPLLSGDLSGAAAGELVGAGALDLPGLQDQIQMMNEQASSTQGMQSEIMQTQQFLNNQLPNAGEYLDEYDPLNWQPPYHGPIYNGKPEPIGGDTGGEVGGSVSSGLPDFLTNGGGDASIGPVAESGSLATGGAI